jgi:hypothetical protein
MREEHAVRFEIDRDASNRAAGLYRGGGGPGRFFSGGGRLAAVDAAHLIGLSRSLLPPPTPTTHTAHNNTQKNHLSHSPLFLHARPS